jgi:hypothetical protein
MLSHLKNTTVKTLLAGLLVSLPLHAHAETLVSVGNAVIRPKAVEQIIRESIADALTAHISSSSMSFNLPAIDETIPLPETNGDLKSILDVLGLKDQIAMQISPIQADFTLPKAGLKIDIKNRGANSFAISAKWSLTALSAKANTLLIHVPAGVFGQAFDIASSPLQMGLKAGTQPIQLEIDLLADLNESGAKFKMQGFHTNLTDTNHPEFSLVLGQLTVNNAPLTLQITSNGQTLQADEPSIRAELQTMESAYIDSVRLKIIDELQSNVAALGQTLQKLAPLKFDFSSDDLIAAAPASLSAQPGVRELLGGLELSGLVSYLQSIPSANVYSSQVSAKICLDKVCVANSVPVTQISSQDLRAMQPNEDLGVVLYESFLQSVVNTQVFQKRFATYYNTTGTAAGAKLAQAGVKVYVDPNSNALIAILNLEIDISKTATSKSPFAQRIQADIGGLLESEFGAGKLIQVPIPISIQFGGIATDSTGTNLTIRTALPAFASPGTFAASSLCSISDCPNNVSKMTGTVRKSFLKDLETQVAASVPSEIKIPLQPIILKTFEFNASNVTITPDHGLLITGNMKNTPGAKP